MSRKPFTEEQVANINEYQQSGAGHPFTCTTGSHVLIANSNGLYCPQCSLFHQIWVHDSMANGEFVKAHKEMISQFKPKTQ